MNTATIVVAFFGAAFLIVLLIATRLDRYRLQYARPVDEALDNFGERPEVSPVEEIVAKTCTVESGTTDSGSARLTAVSEEWNLPEACKSSYTPSAALEMIAFRNRTCSNPYDSRDLTILLTPSKINHIPLINGLSRRRRPEHTLTRDLITSDGTGDERN